MNENFKKFKKRIWLYIIIKCVAAGLAAGLVAVNAALLPCTLCGVKLFWLYYALIALAGFAAGGGLAFLFLRTDDKKIARQLDDDLSLDERVQTALSCKREDGLIYDMQRSDTNEALSALALGALGFRNVALFAACCAIFFAGMISAPLISAFVPAPFALAQEERTEKPEPQRPVTDWEWKALDDLIEYVKASKKADAPTKAGMVYQLEGLRNVLSDGSITQSGLNVFVQNTVNGIRNAVRDANDAEGITEEQQALNSEEEAYVINRLYEIFSLKPSGEGEAPPTGSDPGEEDPTDPSIGPGGEKVNDTPFFDPERGYVKLGDVRDEYYLQVQEALAEGTISREEWEHIMTAYFADLVSESNN